MRRSERNSDPDLAPKLLAVRNLIWSKAWQAWKRLPPSAKIWVDVDDLYQEAVLEVIAKSEKYNPSAGAWTTYVWTVVHNRLSNSVKYYSSAGRSRAELVPLSVLELQPQSSFSDPIVDAVLLCMLKMSPAS